MAKKTFTITFTAAEHKIIKEALLSVLIQNLENRPERVIRAAEQTQDVEPVAIGAEEWYTIHEIIDQACGTFIDAQPDVKAEVQGADMSPNNFFTSVYLTDRAYGGAEEGGWYYDVHELQEDQGIASFPTREAAEADAVALRAHLLPGLNKGRYEISSVLSTGRFTVHVSEGKPEANLPINRPTYE